MSTTGIGYQKIFMDIKGNLKNIHIVNYEQGRNEQLTLLISKLSEAVNPNQLNNHIGDGATIDTLLKHQQGVRFVINGGFSHYRKYFYDWSHQNFNVGDPVGLVKIREHLFEDYIHIEQYGFLVQTDKSSHWTIKTHDSLTMNEKYILGCTPLLIFNKKAIEISEDVMIPVPNGTVNPPSVLGHGLQCHPRTAVGIKDNQLYFIIVDGDETGAGGCTLLDLQFIGIQLQLDSLLNLDGGGSSQFRLVDNQTVIKNYVHPADESRILGHTLIIFDESLKNIK